MTDTANDSMSAAEYRAETSVDPTAYDAAVAIDPGKNTGVAWTDCDGLHTATTDFWDLLDEMESPERWPPDVAVILEAPYLSRPGMSANNTALAYRSGQVAREAQLVRDRLESLGYDIVEHDPSQQGSKWDSDMMRQIVGDWDGPDNEHTRDALRLLLFYSFI